MGLGKLNAGGNPAMSRLAFCPGRGRGGGGEILLVTSGNRNQGKFQPGRPLGLYSCMQILPGWDAHPSQAYPQCSPSVNFLVPI